MKILYHHRIGSKDGQYVHIEELVAALREAGHEVQVVGPSGFDARSLGGESRLISRLKRLLPGACYEFMEFAYNLIDGLRLGRAVRRFRPDVIYERYNLFLLSGVLAARVFRVPLLLEVNAPLYRERRAFGGLALPALARWSERRVWRGADHVFCVTQVLADEAAACGVEPARLSCTPNGIDPGRFHAATAADIASARADSTSALVLGFVGFAREWHGLDSVVDLLAEDRSPQALRFVLVGDGCVVAELEAKASALGVADRLQVTGIVERDDIPGHVRAFDIAIVANVVAYASPLKLFEYMACSKAIVAPSSANIREVLTDGVDALLFEPGDREAFKRAVRRLVDSPELRARLGQAARQTLQARNLTWDANARRVTDIAQRLLDDSGMSGDKTHELR